MRILLVNTSRFNGIPVIREERCEITERYSILSPYSLLQIASILRAKGYEVQLILPSTLGTNMRLQPLEIARKHLKLYETVITKKYIN